MTTDQKSVSDRFKVALFVDNNYITAIIIHMEPVSRSPCALLKLDFLTNAMHLFYALVRKSNFSNAQGFVKPTYGILL